MGNIKRFEPRTPKATTELVRYLRDMADAIESGLTETDPKSALIVLTGSTQHEVLHVGHDAQPGFLMGALRAAQAVYRPNYDTMGGNIRERTHGYDFGEKRGDVVELRIADHGGQND